MSRPLIPGARPGGTPSRAERTAFVLEALRRARALQQEGRIHEAEELCRKALKVDAHQVDARLVLGNLALQRGDTAEAVSQFRRAVAERPGSADTHFSLGAAYLRARRHADALSCFDRALALGARQPEWVHFSRADALGGLARQAEAAAAYEAGLAIRPDHAEALRNLGVVRLALGRVAEALESVQRALALRTDDPRSHNVHGCVLAGLGRHEDAQAAWSRALELDPRHADALNNSALAFEGQGRTAEAVARYRAALEIAPGLASAHNNLGLALIRNGEYDEARRHLESALALDPGNASARHLVAALQGESPARPPRDYVAQLFDASADAFDDLLQGTLRYESPRLLAERLGRLEPPLPDRWAVLDLGCGTGLCGLALGDRAAPLVGVDLSARMLERARGRGTYTRLVHADLVAAMHAEPAGSFDVVIAADVFVYLGSLDDALECVPRLLRSGGVLAFTVEALGGSAAYQLTRSGRYAHGESYLADLAARLGFRIMVADPVELRLERGVPVPGVLHVWRLAEGSG